MDVVFPIIALLLILSLVAAVPRIEALLARIQWGFAVLRDELLVQAARKTFRGGPQ